VSTPFPETALDAGRLRELTEAELDDLQALLDRCGDYYRLHEGRDVTPSEARDEWDDLPDAAQRTDKHVVGLYAGELVGVVEVLCDWPRAATWNIGLLLLDPAVRGRAAGTQIVEAIDARAAEAGADTLRISVIPENARGMAFWRRLGFHPVPSVGTHGTAIALERAVAGAR
jgi:GNAT superfamily N-acetyltransferase